MRGIIWIRLDAIKDTGAKPSKGLIESIATYGLLQNVVVRSAKDGYEVIAGRRRVEAARNMGEKGIPAIVLGGDATEEDLALITLLENMQRTSNPVIEAKAIKKLMDRGHTQREIAKAMGVDRSQVAKRALLLKLTPRLLHKLEKGQLRPSVARELAQLSEEEQRRYEERDNVTLKEVKEYRRMKTLEELKKVEVDRLEPEPEPEPETEGETEVETETETWKNRWVPQMVEKAGLTDTETRVLQHAYRIGLFKAGRGVKRPSAEEAAKDYGIPKTTYNRHLVEARRKILTLICRAVFG